MTLPSEGAERSKPGSRPTASDTCYTIRHEQARSDTAVADPSRALRQPVSAVIADAGEHDAHRFLEFFAASIRNRNTRIGDAGRCPRGRGRSRGRYAVSKFP